MASWYPFGEKTFIFRDLKDQYLGFYEHFNNVLRGDESFMYSMYKGLGGSMYGLWTYYLMSPFNLIFLFFNGNDIITGVNLVYILKLLAMTVTATYYFNKKSVRQPLSMILTLGWVFSGYVIQYRIHLMWLDALILLPLLVYALEEGLKKGRYVKFTILLTLTIFINYYIGYMVGIFTVIYTLYMYLIKGEEQKLYIWGYVKNCLYSGVMSLVILVPTAYEVFNGNGQGLTDYRLFNTFSWDGLLVNFRFVDLTFEGFSKGAPLLSMGTAALILLVLVFIGVEWKYKKAFVTVVLVYLLSFIISPLSLIWTMGRYETGNLYRYSFTLVWFALIFIANNQDAMGKKQMSKKAKIVILTGLITTSVPLLYSQESLSFIVGLILVFMSVIYVPVLFTDRVWYLRIMVLLAIVEVLTIQVYSGIFIRSIHAPEYIQKNTESQTILKEIKELPYYKNRTFSLDGWFDVANQGFTQQIAFSSHSSSLIEETTDLLYQGLKVGEGYSYTGRGMTDVTQSLLGISYVIKQETLPTHATYLSQEQYHKINNQLYENTVTMPFAYTIGDLVPQYQRNDGIYYNQVTKAIFGKDYLTGISVQPKESYNLTIKGDSYVVDDDTKDAYIVYKEQDRGIYLVHNFQLTTKVTEDDINFFNSFHLQCVGCNTGDIELKGYIKEFKGFIDTKGNLPNFYDVDKETLLSDIKNYTQDHAAMEISDESTHTILIGKVNNTHKDPYLQVSLPYAKGWTATINGVQVDIEESMHRLAISIPEGEFEVELRYITPYLKESLVLTIIGLFLFIGDSAYSNRAEKRGKRGIQI